MINKSGGSNRPLKWDGDGLQPALRELGSNSLHHDFTRETSETLQDSWQQHLGWKPALVTTNLIGRDMESSTKTPKN